jgi:hypothetical protein
VLDGLHPIGMRTLWAAGCCELDALVLLKAAVPLSLDRRVVHESGGAHNGIFQALKSCGLTRNALPSSSAAPVNSLSTSAPLSSWRQATYSLATRFMPSSEVTSITSAARNKAAISSHG